MTIDGKSIASDIITGLEKRVAALGFKPVFCDVLVGSDPVQRSYVNIKGRMAEKIGLTFSLQEFPAEISTAELVGKIEYLNSLPDIAGLIVQLPLPATLDTVKVVNTIRPEIDVDCIGAENSNAFYQGKSAFLPPTAAAIMHLFNVLPIDLSGKRILVLGQGPLVGRPVTHLLTSRGLSVTTADRQTTNIHALLKEADVVISATGQPGLIRGEHVKPDSIIVDAGTAESDGGIAGDVDFDSVSKVASWVTPVPGGVGPVTVAQLLANVISVAEHM